MRFTRNPSEFERHIQETNESNRRWMMSNQEVRDNNRKLRELATLRGFVLDLSFSKDSRQEFLSRVRELEGELGMWSESYNRPSEAPSERVDVV